MHGADIWNKATGVWNLAQFPDAEGLLNIGSHAIDSSRGLVYAQVTQEAEETDQASPILQILDDENLAVLDRIQLPENLAGKSLLSSDSTTMYSISDSGVMVLPMGLLDSVPRVTASGEEPSIPE